MTLDRHVLIGFVLMLACGTSLAQAARVEVILLTEPSGAALQVQDWYRLFSELKVDSLQIRAPQGGERIEVVTQGAGAGATHRVFGQLSSRNEVILPSGRYKLSDRARLGEWLATLRQSAGDRPLGAPRPPFGVPPELLQGVRGEFAKGLDFETKELTLRKFLDQASTRLKTPLAIDPAAAAIIARGEPVRDELRGLALGASLSAALRPAGLILVPRMNAKQQVELAVLVSTASAEFWPLGWAPTATKPEKDLLPELHAVRDIELDEVPVMELVAAVAERLQTPVLVDHAGLARQGLEPDKVKVSLMPMKSTYALVLGRMLVKAKLRYEVRIDDAGKPFLWIMSYL